MFNVGEFLYIHTISKRDGPFYRISHQLDVPRAVRSTAVITEGFSRAMPRSAMICCNSSLSYIDGCWNGHRSIRGYAVLPTECRIRRKSIRSVSDSRRIVPGIPNGEPISQVLFEHLSACARLQISTKCLPPGFKAAAIRSKIFRFSKSFSRYSHGPCPELHIQDDIEFFAKTDVADVRADEISRVSPRARAVLVGVLDVFRCDVHTGNPESAFGEAMLWTAESTGKVQDAFEPASPMVLIRKSTWLSVSSTQDIPLMSSDQFFLYQSVSVSCPPLKCSPDPESVYGCRVARGFPPVHYAKIFGRFQ